MTFSRIMLVAAAIAASGGAAHASSSDWIETEGGRVRLVITGTADAEGRLRGMLDIQLRPGWKTYWRDPGGSGVPPTIDVARSIGITGADFAFPAPQRHADVDFTWAGYDRPVAFPVTFQTAPDADGIQIDADIFLGICQTICIPVGAALALDPADDPENADDKAAVEAAEAALPAAASADFGASVDTVTKDRLTVAAKLPAGATTADFFIAGTDDITFGTTQRADKDGKVLFSIEMSGPDTPAAPGGLFYTLVTDRGAVSGRLTF